MRVLPLVVVLAGAGAFAAIAMGASTRTRRAAQTKSGTVGTVKSSKFGTVLIGGNGHTLYRFTTDTKDHARCVGNCAFYWKPLLVKPGTKLSTGSGATAKLLGTIKSTQGMDQVTYAGFPMYNYYQDSGPGQFHGEGKSNAQNGIKPAGMWYVVNTHGAFVKQAAATGTGTSTSPSSTRTGTSTGGGYGGGGY